MGSYEEAYPKNLYGISNIQKYFGKKTIFITGATGFLGRLLVEKLLRSCPDVKRIYIMVRPKKGKTAQERLKEYFNDPLYDSLQQNHSKSLEKLYIMNGDCCLPDLGLSENDKNTIISEVNCIFHVAATVRFNENLKTATLINVRATRDLIYLAKKITSLDVFVHISTAYSFCPRIVIDEQVYEPGMKADNLIQLIEILDEKKLSSIEEIIKGSWPNTYTFTKAVAEHAIKTLGADLPIAICRPSIVVPTANEPVSGWTNNIFGPTGLFMGIELGIIRILQCKKHYKCDFVPADFVINNMIAAAWSVGSKKNSNINKEDNSTSSNISIYNYVSSNERPITWDECNVLGKELVPNCPSIQQFWHRIFISSSNGFLVTILTFLLQTLPAYLIDFIGYCFGKSLNFVKTYKKINDGLRFLTYFGMKEWTFKDDNVKVLWNELEPIDKELFDFNLHALKWEDYFSKFIFGVRTFVLKESLDTIPKAKRKVQYLRIGHYLLCTVLLSLLLSPIYFFVKYNNILN